jgi:hypothetical protein
MRRSPSAERVENLAYLQGGGQAVGLSRRMSREIRGADRTECASRGSDVGFVIRRTGGADRVTRGVAGGRKSLMCSRNHCENFVHL